MAVRTSAASRDIVMVASEVVPFAKTGGLADVTGALPIELARLGHRVRIALPRYGAIDGAAHGLTPWTSVRVPSAGGPISATIEHATLRDASIPKDCPIDVYAIRYDPYFGRAGLYQENGKDYPDNLERFAFFCRATVELLRHLIQDGQRIDVLHAHDWQTCLAPIYLRTLYDGIETRKIGVLLTIHNLGYQGLFPANQFPKTELPHALFAPSVLEFHGSVNLLKGGIVYADLINTVSPTYAREIQSPELGFGLDGVIAKRQDRLVGVVNGIDVAVWNPADDPYLSARYSIDDLTGKRACKAAVQGEYGLPARDVPVLGLISRLADQKGIDLFLNVLPELLTLDLQTIVLGTGDPSTEDAFRTLARRFPDKLGVRIGFDEGLAHRIEAGADLFVMPSRYEPCGLSQLYSLRYGTIPVVRRTGGLTDTVVPYSPANIKGGKATGFRFGEAAGEDLLSTILLALNVYRDPEQWKAMMLAAMRTDVSWARSARAYQDLYERLAEIRKKESASSV
ncbi:MAG TPA: glycogen synthase GlgA [Nitrospirales bacterium]|nr:glycogen synthase GlgA [Nitrospirales bacterium]